MYLRTCMFVVMISMAGCNSEGAGAAKPGATDAPAASAAPAAGKLKVNGKPLMEATGNDLLAVMRPFGCGQSIHNAPVKDGPVLEDTVQCYRDGDASEVYLIRANKTLTPEATKELKSQLDFFKGRGWVVEEDGTGLVAASFRKKVDGKPQGAIVKEEAEKLLASVLK